VGPFFHLPFAFEVRNDTSPGPLTGLAYRLILRKPGSADIEIQRRDTATLGLVPAGSASFVKFRAALCYIPPEQILIETLPDTEADWTSASIAISFQDFSSAQIRVARTKVFSDKFVDIVPPPPLGSINVPLGASNACFLTNEDAGTAQNSERLNDNGTFIPLGVQEFTVGFVQKAIPGIDFVLDQKQSIQEKNDGGTSTRLTALTTWLEVTKP